MASEAQSTEQQVIDRLAAEGYRDIRISRTWLGRVRFVARGPAGEREIVINPSTGAVLRDFLDPEEGDDDSRNDDGVEAALDRMEEDEDEEDEDDDHDKDDDGPEDDDEADEDDGDHGEDGGDDGGDEGDEEDD